jgi:hypothetical protein
MKIGSRAKIASEKSQVKQHMKYMYKIMDSVKELASTIHDSGVEWTEDNIEEVAAKFTDMNIANMEKFLLLGNLQLLKDEAKGDNAN